MTLENIEHIQKILEAFAGISIVLLVFCLVTNTFKYVIHLIIIAVICIFGWNYLKKYPIEKNIEAEETKLINDILIKRNN